jgi:hypothetical protein
MLKSIVVACALALAAAARADEPTTGSASPADAPYAAPVTNDEQSGWTFTAVPYAWAVRLNGRAALFGFPESPVSVSSKTLLQHFRAGVMLGGEARHDRFTIFGDVFAVRVDGLAAPVPATERVNEVIATLGVGYTVIQRPRYQLDVIGGARLWSTSNRLTFTAGPLTGHSLNDGDTWVDPFVGLRGHVDFAGRFYGLGWAEIGGGLSSGSKNMWDLMGGVGYRLGRRTSLLAGYRADSVDRRHGTFVYDVVHQGPFIGLTARF